MIDRSTMSRKIEIIEGLFQIPDKDGNTVPFILNEVQRKYALEMTGRDIIVKARQEGFSSFIEALFLLDCIVHDNIRAVVIAHDKESTQRLFNRVKFFVNNIKGPKPTLEYDSRSEMTFPKTNSTFYIGTAGSKQFGRGDTIHRLHCSEVAFWETGKDILAGLMQAVPGSGQIALESTGNGVGNFFHRRSKRALDMKGKYKLHFYSWAELKEYQQVFKLRDDAELWEEDLDRQVKFKLSNSQLRWYANKRADMMDSEADDEGYKLFLQEYPSDFDEAFRFGGGKFFPNVERTECAPIKRTINNETRWRNAVPGHDYTIGIDMGGGVDLDYSVIEVVDITAGEQVLEWRSKLTPPENIGPIAVRFGKEFNNAVLVPESNNHGYLLVDYLKNNYQPSRIFRQMKIRAKGNKKSMEYGWFTSDKAKFHMCDHGRTVLNRGFKIYSPTLETELQSYEEKPGEGNSTVPKLGSPKGEHDDTVIAFMLALYGVPRLFVPKVTEKYETNREPVEMSFKAARQLCLEHSRRKFRPGYRLSQGYSISGVV